MIENKAIIPSDLNWNNINNTITNNQIIIGLNLFNYIYSRVPYTIIVKQNAVALLWLISINDITVTIQSDHSNPVPKTIDLHSFENNIILVHPNANNESILIQRLVTTTEN